MYLIEIFGSMLSMHQGNDNAQIALDGYKIGPGNGKCKRTHPTWKLIIFICQLKKAEAKSCRNIFLYSRRSISDRFDDLPTSGINHSKWPQSHSLTKNGIIKSVLGEGRRTRRGRRGRRRRGRRSEAVHTRSWGRIPAAGNTKGSNLGCRSNPWCSGQRARL